MPLTGGFTYYRVTKSFEWEGTIGGLRSTLLRVVHSGLRTRLLCTGVHQDYTEWLLPILRFASSNVLSALPQSLESKDWEVCVPLSCSPYDRAPKHPGGSSGRGVPPQGAAGLLQ